MSKSLETFGKYVLLERLAAGGMAEVYLAKSIGAGGINKFLAIKRILPQYSDNPDFIEMFKEEASIAVNLNHSNVVSIFDFGIEKKQFYLVMEYVEGQNLRQILNHLKKENKYFSIDQIVYICKEVAAGLDHAHRCLDGTTGKPLNITHRDMSPQNVMVSFEGEVKVVDFGIAKKSESDIEATRAGTIKGKFGYMSPEQADGQIVDLRTDIFSLGTVLWELLANDRLFASNSEAATLKKIRDCQIPSLRKLNPSIPPELERIVNKALAKDKTLRYQTAAAFHRDLNRFLNTQYPEFSPHDFSVFMKSAFSSMFMENRKKLIEFAKIKADHFSRDFETAFTSTLTETEHQSRQPQSPSEIEEPMELNLGTENEAAPSLPVPPTDIKDLQKKTPTKLPQSVNFNHTNTSAIGGVRGTVSGARPSSSTTTRARRPSHDESSSNSALNLIFIIALVAGGGWYYFKTNGERSLSSTSTNGTVTGSVKNPEPVPKISAPNSEAPAIPVPTNPSTIPQPPIVDPNRPGSREIFSVIIQSNPSGARIYIDGQDTGMITPAQRAMENGKEYSIGLRREGFQFYERKEFINQNGMVIKGSLIANPKMGYLNLDVVNGGVNPVLYIDGVRVEETPPLKNYAIKAGSQVKIAAHNPFTNLWGEQIVKINANQSIKITLIVSQKRSAENNK